MKCSMRKGGWFCKITKEKCTKKADKCYAAKRRREKAQRRKYQESIFRLEDSI
jgi:hypothetical protein